jgi:PadR family transcriptional regulator, regulatory protein PadR
MDAYLGEFEHLVLLAILRLGDTAYAVPIRQELETHAGRSVARGALYTTLDRLEDKRLVHSRLADANEGRGGRPRRYFDVTPLGMAALRNARAVIDRLSNGIEWTLANPRPSRRG